MMFGCHPTAQSLLVQVNHVLTLLNAFPQDIAAEVPKAHAWLRGLFDCEPTTLQMEAERLKTSS